MGICQILGSSMSRRINLQTNEWGGRKEDMVQMDGKSGKAVSQVVLRMYK